MTLVAKEDIPHLAYSAVTLGFRTVPLSLRWRWSHLAAHRVGQLWYRADRASAGLARRNMQAVLGDRLTAAEIEAELQQHFYVTALGKVINDMLPDLSWAELNQFLRIEGEEHVKDALAQGRGLLMLGGHYGLHGYIPITLFKHLGYNFAAVVGHEYPSDSWVYKTIVYPVRSRNWHHVPLINANGTPQRELVGRLQRKEILLIWPDLVNEELFRLPEPHILPTALLGRQMPIRSGAFRLAQWLDTPAVPFFMLPRPYGFAMHIEPPLEIGREKSLAGLRADMAAYAERLESVILRHPGLWWQWRQSRLLELMRPLG